MKRSITISGHRTSLSLEPVFWQALQKLAAQRALSVSALVKSIDEDRAEALDPINPGKTYSLSAHIRVYLMKAALAGQLDSLSTSR
ncbi:MAG: ribbon-helix-helix domain-containing protein [Alphaproteobacteria bacterium]